MTISKIELMAHDVAKSIVTDFITKNTDSYIVEYDCHDLLLGDFERCFVHRGIYGFLISKGGKAAIAYIGKSENDESLRQHLMSKNKNGTPL